MPRLPRFAGRSKEQPFDSDGLGRSFGHRQPSRSALRGQFEQEPINNVVEQNGEFPERLTSLQQLDVAGQFAIVTASENVAIPIEPFRIIYESNENLVARSHQIRFFHRTTRPEHVQ